MFVLVLAAALVTAQATAPTVKAPDTPAGRALTEFVDSFNAGGKTRQAWLETRTTIGEETRADVLKMDAQVLEEYGRMAVARILSSSDTKIVAVVRHGTSDVHGHLTIDVDTTPPHKIVNMGLRGATPEEVKGGGGFRFF